MTVRRVSGTIGLLAAILAVAVQPACSQKRGPANTPERTRQVLIANAKALESRGRPDMAIQLWQQILLSEPDNPEALAGLARDLKLSGNFAASESALQKLRKISPNDPNIAKIQSLASTHAQSGQLRQAGELAREGKNEEAMRIYRELYGDRPPDGDIALAYYETLYGTSSGKEKALAGMRALADRNPGDPRYAIELGRLLTFDPRTRADGIHLLQAHAQNPDARDALRQALIWDASNPHSAAEMREYLKTHPNDTEIAGRLKENEQKLAVMNSGIARTPAERAAFAALNRHHLDEAQRLFMALLEKDPRNGRAAAGMGFLRMQQNNFAGAISFLTQAVQSGYQSAAVQNALKTSRFWYTMDEAAFAFKENQSELAAAKYREALAMRPGSSEALNGLAGLLLKQEQYTQAAAVYEKIIKLQPRNTDGWRGLFLCYARDGQSDKALALIGRFPAPIRTAMLHDPEYLRTLATIYNTKGNSAAAQRVLSQALALPFPEQGAHLKSDTRLQYASILMQSRRFDQAAAMYDQILKDDPSNVSAWMGVVSAHHQLNQDSLALSDVQRMPPATYEAALNDVGFLSMMAAIYQQANQLDIAQNLLERAVKLQQKAGMQPSLQMQLQLAGTYLQRNNTAQAYAIYRQVLSAHPESLEAWKGLIGTLQTTNRNHEALQQIAYIPPAVRQKLETDPQFVQAEASLYAAAGDTAHATQYMNRVQQYYARQHLPLPPDMAIQNAWLLYNTKNDRALYPTLMRLGSRQDLTAAQREVVQTIWANWAVQRAGVAIDNDQSERAVEILEAAAAAFPENTQVRKVLAGGYLKTGRAKEALALYRSVPMQDASAVDFQGAIGAALAANDRNQAEQWLRQGLQRYPNNPSVLGMAARYEQTRGDNQRAADYWRAALAAMPAGSPADRLAHDLAYPDVSTKTHKAVSAADLQRLLDPGSEPFQKTTTLPPLPSYGPDPYLGTAPVMLNNRPPAVANQGEVTAPTTTQIEVPEAAALQATPRVRPALTSGTATKTDSIVVDQSSAASQPGTKANRRCRKKTNYTGQMQVPAPDQNLNTNPPVQKQDSAPAWVPAPESQTVPENQPEPQQDVPSKVPASPDQNNGEPQVFIPGPQSKSSGQAGDTRAAQVQALFAQQTDSQVRPLGNAPIQLPSNDPAAQQTTNAVATSAPDYAVATSAPDYSDVQYTPSAQEAATGAYSARQQTEKQQRKQAAQDNRVQKKQKPSAAESNGQPRQTVRRRRKKETVPTLVTAPTEQNPAQPMTPPPLETEQQPSDTTAPQDGGISDQELQQRNLPPLRGPWVKVRRAQQPLSPRDEAELQLRSLESGYSGWLAGTGLINYRSGNLGYDRLAALEAPFEASAPLGYNGRFTFIVKPVFLDSGQADGTAILRVQEASTAGTALVTIPAPLGTDTNTGPTITTSATGVSSGTPPPQQNAAGLAGEVQMQFPHLAIAVGYTPYGFLVSNVTGRFQWRPGNGPFTFSFLRDSVKDSQLSYAGMRDPGTASLSFPGAIWGGVIAEQANIQYARGDANSGYYFGAGGQYLDGYKVQTNLRYDGTGGAYWRIKSYPEFGTLSIGANFFGMHYAHNENGFTYGMGGYFSPQFYFLANVPFTWVGHYETRWHYEILGGLGIQAFQQDLAPLFPLAAQKANEIAMNNAALPAMTSVSANYNVRGNVSYQISPHWFAGMFITGNNSRDYKSTSAGFSIHYMFRSQPSAVTAPTGLFPYDGFRPFTVP